MKILLIGCGYLGSAIYKHLTKYSQYEIDCVDLCWFGEGAAEIKKVYYFYLTEQYLNQYKTIILTAGHSSVNMVKNDYNGAVWNNLVNFINLLGKLRSEQKFIYCSSSSVYGGLEGDSFAEEEKRYVCLNAYDLFKYECDFHASLSNSQYFGLRLGTLGGAAPLIRADTMANGFFSSFKNKGSIDVFNGHIKRPILGINDACRAIHAILQCGRPENRGIYNLASFNVQVSELARRYSEILNCPINHLENIGSPYDFTISCKKFCDTFNFEFEDTVESIVQSLEDNWTVMNKGIRNVVPERKRLE